MSLPTSRYKRENRRMRNEIYLDEFPAMTDYKTQIYTHVIFDRVKVIIKKQESCTGWGF